MRKLLVVTEKTYRAWRPDQAWLLPPSPLSPQDWLPEGHLVYFLMDAPCGSWISRRSRRTTRGNCGAFRLAVEDNTDPRMMLTLLIFNYATGTRSSRKIMQASNKGWDQCGNAQALVDESQLIIAAAVTPQANAVRQVAPLLDRMEANFAAAEITQRPQDFVADAGDDNTQAVRSHQLTPYLATQRTSPHNV